MKINKDVCKGGQNHYVARSPPGMSKITPPPHISALKPYKPGKPIADVIAQYGLDDVIKLASNENPLGPSPKGLDAALRALPEMHIYPNGGRTLREALAAKYGVSVDEVIAGSGSEGVMNTVMRTFLQHGDEVLTSEGTFTGFYVLANAMGLKIVMAPLRDFGYDLDAIAARITSKTKLIYIANPNNPTGSVFGRKEFEAFYQRVPKNVLIMYDEAYYDFAAVDVPDYFTLVDDIRPNVVTLRTFSKSHGLAGIRIGFGTGHREVIAPMLKVKLPFEPSNVAQAAGLGALEDDDHLTRSVETNQKGKAFFRKVFTELELPYVETAANFFCLPLGSEDAVNGFVLEMEKRGLIVRPLNGFGLSGYARISIGTPEQNERAAQAMKEILSTNAIQIVSENVALT
jgi:histidinol-phosphate aminotransferase